MPARIILTIAAVATTIAAPAAAQSIAPAAAHATSRVLADDPRVADALALLGVWLENRRQYHDIPGISAAVVHDQELVWSEGFGLADLERRVPATAGTIYSICSISKLFTSVALMQQRDAGRVRLDDPVASHLPWFRIERSHPDSPPVRLEGLLTHSSGLPRESGFPYWSAPDFHFPTRDEVQQRIAEQATLYPAERYFQYSNLGMTLAGEVVSAVSGQPYDAYVRTHILAPLGMDDTSPEIPAAERGRRLATGYGRRMPAAHRDVVPFYTTNGIAPAAGFASTVGDLARFASWQFRLLAHGGKEILDANTLREMHRVHWIDPDWNTTWGLGFAVTRDGSQTFVGHGGSCPGYVSHLHLNPRERIATIVMVNASGVESALLTRQAYRLVAPALRQAASDTAADTTGKSVADAALDPYLGVYRSFWGDLAIVRWEGGIAGVSLPTEDPFGAIRRLRSAGEHTFRWVRTDGADEPGDFVRFEIGDGGRATRVFNGVNPMERVR
jgi:CubicO group peptidase (beta-lactamase class C family)